MEMYMVVYDPMIQCSVFVGFVLSIKVIGEYIYIYISNSALL